MFCDDTNHGVFNTCWFDGEELNQACYVSSEPLVAYRTSVATLLTQLHVSFENRFCALSAAIRGEQSDVGAIVCSCMSVGANVIKASIEAGATSVQCVGEICSAGTQCGSCRSEIKAMLQDVSVVERSSALESDPVF